nr:hypothetical protein B0A51_06518 [Rachicladosporium sp. CCFEE 5018]
MAKTQGPRPPGNAISYLPRTQLKGSEDEDPTTKRKAARKLRVIERAAKLMETDEGVEIPKSAVCESCKAAGVVCRVARDGSSVICAYGVRFHNACEAGKNLQPGLQSQPATLKEVSKKRRLEGNSDECSAKILQAKTQVLDPPAMERSMRDSSSPEVPLSSQRQIGKAMADSTATVAAPQGSSENPNATYVKAECRQSVDVLTLSAETEAKRLKRQREDELAYAEIEVLRAEAIAARNAMGAGVSTVE